MGKTGSFRTLKLVIQGVCWQSAKANRQYTDYFLEFFWCFWALLISKYGCIFISVLLRHNHEK